MPENCDRPRNYDAVKGGENLPLVNAAVLGGLPGVKKRLASDIIEQRIAAVTEALKYGQEGLELVMWWRNYRTLESAHRRSNFHPAGTFKLGYFLRI